MAFRKFAPSSFKGKLVHQSTLNHKSGRQSLVGKRIGYDLEGSCISHVGWVSAATRNGIVLNGDVEYSKRQIQNVHILDDQTVGGEWRA